MTDTTKPVEPVALKPCPHCGDDARIKGGPLAQEYFSIWCSNPDCRHHMDGNMNYAATVEKWNTRPATALDAANAEIERLTKERDELRAYAHAATKTITGLTPGGSEYFSGKIGDMFTADLPFCEQRIREQRQSSHELFLKQASRTKKAEAESAAIVAAAWREGWEAGMKEAAQISRNHGFMMDIDWWIKTTKKEVSVFSCNSVAESILAAIKEKQP